VAQHAVSAKLIWRHAKASRPEARRLVGNVPQAFSHIALVNTAHNLAHASKPAEQRSGHPRMRKSAAT